MDDDGWEPSGWADADDGAPVVVDRSLIHPPVRYLVVAACMVGVSAVLVPFTRIQTHILGWVVGSLVTVALMAIYTAVDQRSRLSASYSARPNQQVVRNGLWVAGVLIATVHAWYIANHFAA